VQESLTNAVRHGAAKQVWIAIGGDEHAVRVTVEDDGIGFTDAGGGGMGLRGMRERLAALDGRLTLGTRPDGGTRLAAVIPRARAKVCVA
jgi:signal transduction histidine kinase